MLGICFIFPFATLNTVRVLICLDALQTGKTQNVEFRGWWRKPENLSVARIQVVSDDVAPRAMVHIYITNVKKNLHVIPVQILNFTYFSIDKISL